MKLLCEEKIEKDFKISALIKDLGENREHLEATKNEEGLLTTTTKLNIIKRPSDTDNE